MGTEYENVQVTSLLPKLGQTVVTERGDRKADEALRAQQLAVGALQGVILAMRSDYATGARNDNLLWQCKRLMDPLSLECGLHADTTPLNALILVAMRNHGIDQRRAVKMLGAVP